MNLVFKSTNAHSPGYRADIDGLRAIAVLCVVIYHLELYPLPGGFVGVDVFFVISGYLITQVIQQDVDRGRFSFLSFYNRRIRRILPALIGMALVCTVVAVLFFPPLALLNYGASLLAMTCFVSNIYFERLDPFGGYFGDIAKSQVLLHTWSLSVEEQFYLFYPIALLLLNRAAKRYRPRILICCIALSFAIAILGTKRWPVVNFYILPARAWELLLGAFLAFKSLPALANRVVRELAAVIGLGMIGYAAWALNLSVPFPGVGALLPCLGAGLLLYAGEAGSTLVGQALSLRPVVFVGVISYSLYLWHWPAFLFIRFLTTARFLTQWERYCELLLSLVMAFLSFEFIESPFRHPASRSGAKRTIWAAAGTSAALASVAVALVVSHGMPNRFDPRTREVLTENEVRTNEWPMLGPCANFRTDISRYSDAVFCTVGNSSNNILVWGDSHAQQLYPLLQQIQPELHGKGIVFATASSCPPAEHVNDASPGYSCDLFSRFAMQRASQGDIDTVFIAFSPWWHEGFGLLCAAVENRCIEQLSAEEARRRVFQSLASNVHALKASGKRVIVALPFPTYDKSIPDFEIGVALVGHRWMGPDPQEDSPVSFRQQLQALATDAGADIYDPREALCSGRNCIYQVDGVSLYIDPDHLAASQVGILKQSLLKSLEPVP